VALEKGEVEEMDYEGAVSVFGLNWLGCLPGVGLLGLAFSVAFGCVVVLSTQMCNI